MKRLFIVTSGEHTSLPIAEVRAILEAEEIPSRVIWSKPQLILLDVWKETPQILWDRSAFIKMIGQHILNCVSDPYHIKEEVKNVSLYGLIGEKSRFSVRVKKIQNSDAHVDSVLLESLIGGIIKKKYPRSKVELEHPEIEFIGIIDGERFIFGRKIYEKTRRKFYYRQPKFRPIFHPATLRPNIARCMINLARARRTDTLLDPFCGVGGILIEGGLIGCRIIGVDVKQEMVKGCRENLKHFSLDSDLIVSDAEKLPIRSVDCIATDPPYGTSASTLKRTLNNIVSSFLSESLYFLRRNKFICIAAPKKINIAALGEDAGFKLIEKYLLYIHRSLTREIAVFQKI